MGRAKLKKCTAGDEICTGTPLSGEGYWKHDLRGAMLWAASNLIKRDGTKLMDMPEAPQAGLELAGHDLHHGIGRVIAASEPSDEAEARDDVHPEQDPAARSQDSPHLSDAVQW